MDSAHRKEAGGGGFRWRGHEILRIEGFSDAVLAFAVTLLVVSLEVPKTFDELRSAMSGFLAFGISFAMLIWFWHGQYVFFRRYALQDTTSVILNSVFLFVVLFYVYPLKFLFTFLVKMTLGLGPAHGGHASGEPPIRLEETPALMTIYGGGLLAIFLVLALLYLHAYRRREALALTPVETYDTATSVFFWLACGAVALLSILIAVLGGPRATGVAGFTYGLLGPVNAILGARRGAKRRRLFES